MDATIAPAHRLIGLPIPVKADVVDIDTDAFILGPRTENSIGCTQHAIHRMVLDSS
jgi:hypothetical protein